MDNLQMYNIPLVRVMHKVGCVRVRTRNKVPYIALLDQDASALQDKENKSSRRYPTCVQQIRQTH
jgi:hypothetical protein